MEPKIDKSVPIPGVTRYTKLPLSRMEVGDSFEMAYQYRQYAAMAMSQMRRRVGKVFISRKQTPTTFRVWRIK